MPKHEKEIDRDDELEVDEVVSEKTKKKEKKKKSLEEKRRDAKIVLLTMVMGAIVCMIFYMIYWWKNVAPNWSVSDMWSEKSESQESVIEDNGHTDWWLSGESEL
jgi:uncharacterized protein (DUF2344 family)